MAVILGLDVGTSKVAAVLLDGESRAVREHASLRTNAELGAPADRAEQDVGRIFQTVEKAIRDLDPCLLREVAAIGITGQMHGVVLWNSRTKETGNLISWQDRRCSSDGFLALLNGRIGGSSELRDGYGCATLAWTAAHHPDEFGRYDRASTIHDLLAANLCDLTDGVTDPSDAASWGLFDVINESWQREAVDAAGIPFKVLPAIRPFGSSVGTLSSFHAGRLGIKPGIPVFLPLGDNQASLFATLSNPEEEIALTLGTGGQLSLILPKERYADLGGCNTIEFRPYPGGKLAAVAASLCGGKAFDWVNETVLGWCRTLGMPQLDKDELFTRLNDLGMESVESPLKVCSSFLGERFDPALRGEIRNIDLANFTLGNLASAVVRDVVENLKSMVPGKLLEGRTRIVGSGNGIRKLPLMQRTIEQVFGLPLTMPDTVEEAASGAALYAYSFMKN